MFDAILQEIQNFDTIILHRHARPDGDAMGSQIGLKHLLLHNFPGKCVYTVGDGAGHLSFMEDSRMDEISDETYRAIKEGMNGVVNDPEGTAWASFNQEKDYITPDVCPYVDVICAKTGTSQHGSGGSDHGSFVAFAPMDDPEIAIAMYGEKVGHGYSMARATREVLEYYLSGDEAAEVETYENRPG